MLLTASLLPCAGNVWGQNVNDSVRIFFHQGKAEIDPTLYTNRTELLRLQQLAESGSLNDAPVYALEICGWTSPEGGERLNHRLAEQRAQSIWRYLLSRLNPEVLSGPSAWRLDFSYAGTDWKRLYAMLVRNRQVPHAESAAKLFRNFNTSAAFSDSAVARSAELLRRLRQIGGGSTYAYLYRSVFPQLRSATVHLVRRGALPDTPADTNTEAHTDTVYVTARDTLYITDTLVVHDTLYVAVPAVRSKRPFYVGVKTNLLYDAAVVPNLSVEVYLRKGWSVAANWMYTWIKNDHKHRYWRIYGGEAECNRWLGKRRGGSQLSGHHLGVYGQLVTYDVEWGTRGYLGDKWTYGGGLTYGYSLPLRKRLNLDFALAVGYLGGTYKEYLPIDGHYVWQKTRKLRWFGPTRLAVQLVWLLGRGNRND